MAGTVEIFGKTFKQMQPDEVICAEAAEAFRGVLRIDLCDEKAVLEQLRSMSESIDRWLGAGACRSLCDGQPISLRMMLKWMNEILRVRSESYAAYIAGEYYAGI